ncbi:hypothetical protein B0H14DRAFT_2637603 [Mycena olivaceomarginata]|nr:hypothetical protein B0H14DRAFT_2637603 [Mycena olivaceomarginata]
MPTDPNPRQNRVEIVSPPPKIPTTTMVKHLVPSTNMFLPKMKKLSAQLPDTIPEASDADVIHRVITTVHGIDNSVSDCHGDGGRLKNMFTHAYKAYKKIYEDEKAASQAQKGKSNSQLRPGTTASFLDDIWMFGLDDETVLNGPAVNENEMVGALIWPVRALLFTVSSFVIKHNSILHYGVGRPDLSGLLGEHNTYTVEFLIWNKLIWNTQPNSVVWNGPWASPKWPFTTVEYISYGISAVWNGGTMGRVRMRDVGAKSAANGSRSGTVHPHLRVMSRCWRTQPGAARAWILRVDAVHIKREWWMD